MEIDLSLLNEGDWNGEKEAEVLDTIEQEVSSENKESNETTSEESQEEATQRETTERDDFDDSTPLSPREKVLLERLEKLTGETFEKAQATPTKEETFSPQERNFLEGISDLDEVLSSPESLNKLLQVVYKIALEDASKLSAEKIMRNLPATISHYTNQHVEMKEIIKDFYDKNADLIPIKKTLATVANDISAEHPEYTTERLLEESAKKTREMLRIKANAPSGMNKTAPRKGTPAFASQRSSNGRVKGEQLTGLEADIAELLS